MKYVIGGLAMFLGFIVLITLASFLFAFPTMWLVNYLFNPMLLATIFTTGHITVWNAWALNILASLLFKSTNTSSKN